MRLRAVITRLRASEITPKGFVQRFAEKPDWLDPANNDKELLLATMQPATSSGAGGLTSYPVSTAVNSVRNNGPALVEPLGDAGSLAGGPGSGDDRERPPQF